MKFIFSDHLFYLHLCAKLLEENEFLKEEMRIWDENFSQDGLENL